MCGQSKKDSSKPASWCHGGIQEFRILCIKLNIRNCWCSTIFTYANRNFMELTWNVSVFRRIYSSNKTCHGPAPVARLWARDFSQHSPWELSLGEGKKRVAWKPTIQRLRFSKKIPSSSHRLILFLISLRAFQSCLSLCWPFTMTKGSSWITSNLIIWVKIYHASPFVHLSPKSLCLCISAYKHTIHKNA